MQQKTYISLKQYYISLFILLILFLPSIVVISEAEPSIITSAPIIFYSSVNPTKVQPGDQMIITASVFDPFGVEKVQAKFFHEEGSDPVNLFRVLGSKYWGVWQGCWKVHDTKVKEYTTTVTAFSHSGFSSSTNLTWWDPASWWNTDWAYRKNITLNSGQVPSDQTNFPVLISITDTDLRDDAQSDGDDIAFANSSGNKLNHEIEKYTSGTGELVAWVNITSLSGSSDTEIYMYYGNSGCSSQENIVGVWDSNFAMVQHLNETPANDIAGHLDSTSNNNDGTPKNFGGISGSTTDATGKIDGADELDGSNDYVSIPTSTDFAFGTGDFTMETWYKSAGTARTSCWKAIVSIGDGHTTRHSVTMYVQGTTSGGASAGSFIVLFDDADGATSRAGMGVYASGSPQIDDSNWHHLVVVVESGNFKYFVDGNHIHTGNNVGNLNIPNQPVYIGTTPDCGTYLNGITDEVHVSDTARSADWITTEYNNVNNATDGGFYSIGSEEVAIPGQPTLSSPENNTCTNDITPTFQWTTGENADNHTLLVDNETDLSDGDEWINVSLSSSTSSYTTPGGKALSEGRWYWKVIANNSQGSNSSDVWSFIVDTTPPLSVNLSSPANGNGTDSSSVTFSWNSTTDNTTNTSLVSDIAYYNLQVDDDIDFSSPMVDDNTSDNATLSLTKTVTGQLYWRVRAVDNAGNAGSFSEIRNLTVFSFSLTSDSTTLQIKRGSSEYTTLNISRVFGDVENVTLSYFWSGDNQPSSIDVNLSTQEASVSFDSTITFDCGSSATTGTFTCIVNGTSESGIKRTVNITITVYSMLFSLDGFPRSLSLIRSDQTTATISVGFDQGALEDVSLSGTWVDETPNGITVRFSPYSGTPSYDSTVSISTSSSAEGGSFVYRVQGTGSGLTKTVNLYVDILTTMSLTVTTDKNSYEKGQDIQISGTAKDPNGDSVGSGTATILLSAQNWSHTSTTSISNGGYSTSYYITFDKPVGNWNISINATDSKGHETSTSKTTSISVETPENYEHYYINVLSPITGQVFKRGETITFTVSLVDENDEKIQDADVKACFSSGEEIVFSEGSPGIYSTSYDLGYDFQIGNLSLYVEGKKHEDGKLKAGFNYIDFKVQSVKPILELVEPKAGDFIEVGETIEIKIKAFYPDGTPVEEGIITAVGPDGEELIFIRSGTGLYTASYTPTADNVGNWTIQIKIEDAYGNSAVLIGGEVDVVDSKITSYLLRYWWATLLGIFSVASVVINFAHRKLRKVKFYNLKNEILELGKLKKRNAVLYFSEGEITRETYDRLSQEYESKIARLSKKQRMLERKIGGRGKEHAV